MTDLDTCHQMSVLGGGGFSANFQIKFPFDKRFNILTPCNHIWHQTLLHIKKKPLNLPFVWAQNKYVLLLQKLYLKWDR